MAASPSSPPLMSRFSPRASKEISFQRGLWSNPHPVALEELRARSGGTSSVMASAAVPQASAAVVQPVAQTRPSQSALAEQPTVSASQTSTEATSDAPATAMVRPMGIESAPQQATSDAPATAKVQTVQSDHAVRAGSAAPTSAALQELGESDASFPRDPTTPPRFRTRMKTDPYSAKAALPTPDEKPTLQSAGLKRVKLAMQPLKGVTVVKKRPAAPEGTGETLATDSKLRRLHNKVTALQVVPLEKANEQVHQDLVHKKVPLIRLTVATIGKMKMRARMAELTGNCLVEVPITALPQKLEDNEKQRPRRNRMFPLEAWRNETVIYERPKDSETPSVAGVVLNCAPRPLNAKRRWLPCSTMQVPYLPLNDDGDKQFVGVSTSCMESRVITLPLLKQNFNPCTMALPDGASGILHVLAGSAKFGITGGDSREEAVIHHGDTAVLPGKGRQVLLASAHPTTITRIVCIIVHPISKKLKLQALPPPETESSEQQALGGTTVDSKGP